MRNLSRHFLRLSSVCKFAPVRGVFSSYQGIVKLPNGCARKRHSEAHTGSSWRPRSGSKVSHRALTSAVIDSRDFLASRRRAENQLLMPSGTKIAFAGGADCNDHAKIWEVLDKVFAKHPDMVLLHGGTTKGAERIAACWADQRKIAQVVFKPDWTKYGKSAPFKRNDVLLETLPVGVIVFPGSGITKNLADKSRVFGIPVWRFDGGGGGAPSPSLDPDSGAKAVGLIERLNRPQSIPANVG